MRVGEALRLVELTDLADVEPVERRSLSRQRAVRNGRGLDEVGQRAVEARDGRLGRVGLADLGRRDFIRELVVARAHEHQGELRATASTRVQHDPPVALPRHGHARSELAELELTAATLDVQACILLLGRRQIANRRGRLLLFLGKPRDLDVRTVL